MKVSTEGDGYTYILEKRGQGGEKAPIHQLSAIADGADPSKVFSEEWHVHHIDGNKWVNGYDNLELLPQEKHILEALPGRDLPTDEIVDMYVNEGRHTTELAEVYDCSPETIANYLRREGVSLRGH